MSAVLRPNDRRALLLGAAIILSLLGLSRGVPALRVYEASLHVQVEERELRLRALNAELAGRASEQNRLHDVAPDIAAFGGTTPSAAAADAASHLGTTASTLGIAVQSLTPSAPSAFTGATAEVEVRMSCRTDARGLHELLAVLSESPRVTAVRALTVRQGAPTASADVPETLHVELTVAAVGMARARGAD